MNDGFLMSQVEPVQESGATKLPKNVGLFLYILLKRLVSV